LTTAETAKTKGNSPDTAWVARLTSESALKNIPPELDLSWALSLALMPAWDTTTPIARGIPKLARLSFRGETLTRELARARIAAASILPWISIMALPTLTAIKLMLRVSLNSSPNLAVSSSKVGIRGLVCSLRASRLTV
jgi:hypothetical protein